MKRLLLTYKYQPYVSDLQNFLADLFFEGIIQNESFMQFEKGDAVLVPIPLHASKLRKRGYNHAALLARKIGDKMGITYVEGLVRVKKTQSQFLLKKDEREANIKDAFTVNEKIRNDLKDKTVFLVDDVVTSGSTLKEAAKVLKRTGAGKVFGLTLAHGH